MLFAQTQQYNTIHKWVARNFGKATYCTFSKNHKATRYHWANISGKYKKDRNDWQPLCVKCHFQFDIKQHQPFLSSGSYIRSTKTHCKNGHEYIPENTRWRNAGKYRWRICKECANIDVKNYFKRKVEV